ncbi:putative G- coupled receptor Mth-like 1 [Brachionus plicatilis]|uniref:Putative G-coupled receptor Mth-like 1 n=1 Tax=Brachionus plicatilis TaxID=10195 RepID=A0A3M7T1B1_BRAPC|nr:putative G- coupled receptor Mth-like 1 [Brachionus plicatilis]
MKIFYLLFFNLKIVFACDDFCSNKTLSSNLNCFCSECDLYGDCCSDVASKTPTTLQNYECNSKLKEYGTIYTIGKCPDSYRNKKLMLKCVLEPRTIIQSIPVYSNVTRKFFKNIFCAICNLKNAKTNDLKFFSLETKMKYNESILEQRIKEHFEIFKPDGVPWPRKCIKHIQTCPNNFLNLEIISLCSNYTAYRCSVSGNLYKNEHCLRCNEPNSTSICSRLQVESVDYMSLQILFDLRNLQNEIVIEMNVTQTYEKVNFVNFTKIKFDEETDLIKKYITIAGQAISVISLINLIIFYFIKKLNRKLPGKIVISLSVSMIFSHVSFIISSILSDSDLILAEYRTYKSLKEMFKDLVPSLPCFLSGFFLHYFYLSFFIWSSIMAIDLFKIFSSVHESSRGKIFLKYSICAWSIPAIIALVMILKNYDRISYGYRSCFISSSFDLCIFFVMPVGFIIFENILLMLISVKLISGVDKFFKKFTHTQPKRPEKNRIVLFFKIFVVTGLSWILAIISSFINNKYSFMWYIYIVVDSLQGFFIMCIFVFNDVSFF